MTDAQLKEKLKKFRMKKNPLKPFSVFNDAEMNVLLGRKPRTVAELSTIKGFPKDGQRVTKYGKEIVALFKEAPKADSLNAF